MMKQMVCGQVVLEARGIKKEESIIAKKKTTFVCQNCEYHSPKYLGRCPNCGAWSSFVEEIEVAEVKNARVSLTGEKKSTDEVIGGGFYQCQPYQDRYG